MDNLSDQLQSKVFRNLVDIDDFRNCRLVSQKWKRNVVEACRSKFHMVYPLTDSTLHSSHNLRDALVSFDVYSFTGNENQDVWSTSNIEPLMGTIDWLKFSGSDVKPSEIRKFLDLAHDSLKTLSFRCLQKDLTCQLREMHETFGALRKLSLGFYCVEKDNDNFTTFTKTLKKWNSLDCRVQLPLLECLNLTYDSRSGRLTTKYTNGYDPNLAIIVKTEDIFQNYLAIAKLLLKYKSTLREVMIERAVVYFNSFCRSFKGQRECEWADMERDLEALDELNLNHLKLSTTDPYTLGGFNTGIDILGRPKNLKNVLFSNLIYPYDSFHLLAATLSSFNNADGSYLTSIKINLQSWNYNDPTTAIDFGRLQKCRNLKTLWLAVNKIHGAAQLVVRNMELLPTGISIIRLESEEKESTMGREILLSQQQIRWMINNLRGLESCWISLVIPEQTHANQNIEQVDAAAAQLQRQQEEYINSLTNISLDTFSELIVMPKLKDLKLNMMKAKALSFMARHELWQGVQREGHGTTLEAVREYSNLFPAAGYTTVTTTSENFGADNIYGFATIEAQKNDK